MEKTKNQEQRRFAVIAKFFKGQPFNLLSLNKILFALIVALGVLYIAGVNDLAVKGFILSDLKNEYGKIADDNKKLELKAMSLSSYSAVSEKVVELKMVAVGNIEYINNTAGIVAKK